MRVIHEQFTWQGWGNGQGKWQSWCWLSIYQRQDNSFVVIATDMGRHEQDTGTSITNCAEHLIRLVMAHYGLHPDSTMWIEHYPEYIAKKPYNNLPETWSIVTPVINSAGRYVDAKWQHIDKEYVERLIGEKLPQSMECLKGS